MDVWRAAVFGWRLPLYMGCRNSLFFQQRFELVDVLIGGDERTQRTFGFPVITSRNVWRAGRNNCDVRIVHSELLVVKSFMKLLVFSPCFSLSMDATNSYIYYQLICWLSFRLISSLLGLQEVRKLSQSSSWCCQIAFSQNPFVDIVDSLLIDSLSRYSSL